MIGLLVPSVADLASWGGVGFAVLIFIGIGRALTAGRTRPEVALVAGWGVMCLVLTAWGVAVPLSLRGPAVALAVLGVVALFLPTTRLSADDWRALGRVLALSLPLLAVMASARPSEPDTFLNLLPNAAYLYDHGIFPATGQPAVHSLLPAAPYNLQLAGFVAGLLTPQFPAIALIGFNIVLQLAAGLLLARLVAGQERNEAPGWSVTAFGLLLATALNPGFVPRYHLSSYSEPSVMVVLAFAGYLVLRRDRTASILLAAVLTALVEIKQDSIALVLGLVLAAVLQPRELGEHRRTIVLRAIVVAVPSATLYVLWTWYVHTHFKNPDVELTWMPLAQWQWGMLPTIFRQIVIILGEKIVLFGPLVAVLAVVIVRAWRRMSVTDGQRAGLVLLTVTLLYDAALIVSYVGHFSGQMAADAHSFFRYNTHLALLLMVVLVLMLREPARAWFGTLPRRGRTSLSALAILAFIVCPVAFLPLLRFDLETPQRRAWDLAKHLAAAIGPHDRVALILPGDGGSLFPVLDGLLRMTLPRRPDVVLDDIPRMPPNVFSDLATDRWVLISCTPVDMPGVPPGEVALFSRAPDGWRLVAHWPYPAADKGRWSRVISLAPLCLSG
jgi:hypothetical protein